MRMTKEERDIAKIIAMVGIVEELRKIQRELDCLNKEIGMIMAREK